MSEKKLEILDEEGVKEETQETGISYNGLYDNLTDEPISEEEGMALEAELAQTERGVKETERTDAVRNQLHQLKLESEEGGLDIK